MEYRIDEYKEYSEGEILPLYAAVGWTNYTDDPEMLRRSYANSLCILCAYVGQKPVGILRAVGDGHSVVLIQDLLVLPAYHRKGIGSALLGELTARYPNVYQTQLLTDDTPRSREFYEACGFTMAANVGCLAYMKL